MWGRTGVARAKPQRRKEDGTVWQYGSMGVWRYGSLEGRTAIPPHFHTATPPYGSVPSAPSRELFRLPSDGGQLAAPPVGRGGGDDLGRVAVEAHVGDDAVDDLSQVAFGVAEGV